MAVCEKEHKKMKKKLEPKKEYTIYRKKEETLPDWFNKNLDDVKVSEDNQEEMQRLLEELS